jgi:hypothetical protein
MAIPVTAGGAIRNYEVCNLLSAAMPIGASKVPAISWSSPYAMMCVHTDASIDDRRF